MENNQLMNMEDVKTKITDAVKIQFFNLISDEKFNSLVNEEINNFFNATIKEFELDTNIRNNSYYDNESKTYKLKTPISPFRAIVWNKCNEMVSHKIDNIFEENGYSLMQSCLNDGSISYELSPKLEELLSVKVNDMAKSFFKNMFAEAFNIASHEMMTTMQNNIMNQIPHY